MSGLENFKSDNSWRTNFKNLLFMQRTPVHKVVDPLRAANRFSLDIVDDLEDLVTKKKALIDKEMMNSIENKETRTCCSGDAEHIRNTQYKDSTTYNNMLENSVKSVELCSLDDSFEALEKMCNKTASDPNSTLFKYLQSDNKSDILTDFKRKTIYNDLKKNEHNSQVDVDIPVKEVTQLEDIEAPSLLWESSIANEIHQPTSPIKMVGLLRPSTILEENTEGNSENESGLTSYYTAFKSSDSKSFRNFESEIDVTDTIMSSGLGNPEGYLKLDCEKTFKSVKSDDTTTHTTEKKQQIEGMSESDSSDSVIEVLSDNEEGNEYFNTMNFIHHSNIIDGENQLQFNDTLEEVEYMLKKRLDYIKSTPVKCNENSSVELTKNSIKEMHKSISSKTPNKEMHITSRHDNSLFGFDIKPFPKLSVFKHPAAKSGIPSNRNQFAHVVSPIGVYMKNTAITPLISTMKCNNKQHISNTSAFKDVEFESRLQKTPLKTIESSALYSNSDDIPTGSKILPKKAYISCNLKQITDERTRLKIPGGKKIQKYLEPAMLPAVVRHDGKAKNHGHQNTKTEFYESNNSLVNLSVASGDVSLYTIVDARKF